MTKTLLILVIVVYLFYEELVVCQNGQPVKSGPVNRDNKDRDNSGSDNKHQDNCGSDNKDRGDKERSDKERGEKERDDKERGDKDRDNCGSDNKDRGDKERGDKDRGDKDRGDKDRGDKDRGDKERGDKDRCDKDRGDKDRGDKERGDKDRGDKDRCDKDRGDKDRGDKERGDKDRGDKDRGKSGPGNNRPSCDRNEPDCSCDSCDAACNCRRPHIRDKWFTPWCEQETKIKVILTCTPESYYKSIYYYDDCYKLKTTCFGVESDKDTDVDQIYTGIDCDGDKKDIKAKYYRVDNTWVAGNLQQTEEAKLSDCECGGDTLWTHSDWVSNNPVDGCCDENTGVGCLYADSFVLKIYGKCCSTCYLQEASIKFSKRITNFGNGVD